jgi:hypothetical protein
MVPYRVNLGGEGEIVGVVNQQPPWVVHPDWRSSRTGETLQELVAHGVDFLICPNLPVALPDSCADEVLTNDVPVDLITFLGLGVQSNEVNRILKPGGKWIHDGLLRSVKP